MCITNECTLNIYNQNKWITIIIDIKEHKIQIPIKKWEQPKPIIQKQNTKSIKIIQQNCLLA